MNDVNRNLERLLKTIETRIRDDNSHKANIKKWIGTYLGKIIAFQVGDDSLYFVFKNDGNFEIRMGGYPSCDVFIKGSYEDIENTLQRKLDPRGLINESKMLFYGNYNELISFMNLIPSNK